MTSKSVHRTRRWTMTTVALVAALATVLTACGSSGNAHAQSAGTVAATPAAIETAATPASGTLTASEDALYAAMHGLWDQHMEWTYATVAAFAAGTNGLTPTLNRLLQNQTDIGNAIKPFYGDAAGNELSTLLHAHIMGYVPLLQAAKAGDQAKAKTAFAAVLANGVLIGKFLEKANSNWPAPGMEQMMNTHNNQTLQYAADQLGGKYADSIAEYGQAEAHMAQMADMLSAGIIKQFPDKFTS